MTVDRDKLRTKLQFVRDAVGQLTEIRARGEQAFLEAARAPGSSFTAGALKLDFPS